MSSLLIISSLHFTDPAKLITLSVVLRRKKREGKEREREEVGDEFALSLSSVCTPTDSIYTPTKSLRASDTDKKEERTRNRHRGLRVKDGLVPLANTDHLSMRR